MRWKKITCEKWKENEKEKEEKCVIYKLHFALLSLFICFFLFSFPLYIFSSLLTCFFFIFIQVILFFFWHDIRLTWWGGRFWDIFARGWSLSGILGIYIMKFSNFFCLDSIFNKNFIYFVGNFGEKLSYNGNIGKEVKWSLEILLVTMVNIWVTFKASWMKFEEKF